MSYEPDYSPQHPDPGPRRRNRYDLEQGSDATRVDWEAPAPATQEHEHMLARSWHRFTRKGKKNVGVAKSFASIARSSFLNIFIIFIPLAWVAHYIEWGQKRIFLLCFLAIIPLEHLLEYGGEQMAHYCGQDLGDLIVVTLDNAVEAALGISLLIHCEINLLQSTLIGVILLHLLFVPGVAFITGGARIESQELHPHLVQLNQALLAVGVLALLLPAAFFSGISSTNAPETVEGLTTVFTDSTKRTLLEISRGVAIILLIVYLASRIYLHNPPGENNILALHPLAPKEFKEQEHHLSQAEPDVNQYVCIALLLVVLCLTGLTAEFLVLSISFIREKDHIQIEWFGLILLPFVSWAADGVVSLYLFLRAVWKRLSGRQLPYTSLAKGRSIDMSVQFTLFWMPFLVLLGWWLQHPMTLLFDFYEIAALLGATFLVNYVTSDAKTNWAEGFILVSFYAMIALGAWFYTGQPALDVLLYERWPEKCDALAHSLEVAGSAAGGGH